MNKNKYIKGIGFYVLLFAVILVIFALYASTPPTEPKTYTDLYTAIQKGEVKRLSIVEQDAVAILDDGTKIEVNIPPLEQFYEDLGAAIRAQMESGKLVFNPQPPAAVPWWLSMLPTLVLVIIFIVFWVFFLQQSQGGGGGKVMQFGKSKAHMINEDAKKYRFTDVAGARRGKGGT